MFQTGWLVSTINEDFSAIPATEATIVAPQHWQPKMVRVQESQMMKIRWLTGGGFKYSIFSCSPRKLGKWSNLTNIFQLDWFNHQLDDDGGSAEVVSQTLENGYDAKNIRKKPMNGYHANHGGIDYFPYGRGQTYQPNRVSNFIYPFFWIPVIKGGMTIPNITSLDPRTDDDGGILLKWCLKRWNLPEKKGCSGNESRFSWWLDGDETSRTFPTKGQPVRRVIKISDAIAQ